MTSTQSSEPLESETPLVIEQEWALRSTDLKTDRRGLSMGTLRAAARYGFLSFAGAFRRFGSATSLRCLYMHSVYDDQVHHFRAMLRALKGHGRFVTTQEVVEVVEGTRSIGEHCFHLSFDDGFDNNYRNVFPVLEELEIPATFFVPTALVDAPDDEVLARWWTPDPVPTRLMCWDELREMRAAGHEIGSHTRHHARLSDVSGDDSSLRDEIIGSKREVEDALGEPCRFISWPFGTSRDFDQRAGEVVREAGYRACFSAVRGTVVPGSKEVFAIPRHHLDVGWPWLHVRFFASGGWEAV